jgi:ABC-type anion transport system duplicated permease subunit
MKVYFLAFGILIYLLPIVVQRIDEVNDVYLKTVYTLGANAWQTIRSVYIPSVMSRLSDDIRVLTAISWTYIIVAEGIASEGGLGPLIYRTGQRMGRIDKVFAGLVLIIIIGALQDRIFVFLDKEFFPHKYQNKGRFKTTMDGPSSLFKTILDFSKKTLVWILIGFYFILAINEYFPILSDVKLLDYLFGDTIWVIHLIFCSMLIYKARKLFLAYNKEQKLIEAA